MSLTKAGPPTAPKTRFDPPNRMFRSGFRAWRSNSDGAVASKRLDVAGIEPDATVRTVDARAGARERIERPVAEHLNPDLGQHPQRRPTDRLDLVGRQDYSTARNGFVSRRQGSCWSPGAARRGRRRGPSCGSGAAGGIRLVHDWMLQHVRSVPGASRPAWCRSVKDRPPTARLAALPGKEAPDGRRSGTERIDHLWRCREVRECPPPTRRDCFACD